jgi:hypothetical protein
LDSLSGQPTFVFTAFAIGPSLPQRGFERQKVPEKYAEEPRIAQECVLFLLGFPCQTSFAVESLEEVCQDVLAHLFALRSANITGSPEMNAAEDAGIVELLRCLGEASLNSH